MFRMKDFAYTPVLSPSVNAESGLSRATAFAHVELGFVEDVGRRPDFLDMIGMGPPAARQRVSVSMEAQELRELAGMLTRAADAVEAFQKLVTGGKEVDTSEFFAWTRAAVKGNGEAAEGVEEAELTAETPKKPARKKKKTVFAVPGSGASN
jgi:hypothetical protein